MRNLSAVLLVILLSLSSQLVKAAEATSKLGTPQRPIRALLVCGGCCHDYTRQKQIIAKGVSARANVIWTIVQQGGTTTNAKIPLYRDKNWSDGFDVVVHNECFSGVPDKDWVENIIRPHREGLPAILIHCAMHSYRTGDDKWFEFVGMQSPRHGAHYSYQVDNVKPDHPAMLGFGETFIAPKGELYYSIKLFDTATVLGQAKRKPDGEPQICIWTNKYGKGNVFATTIGHYNETMAEPAWLDMLTRGILWSVDLNPAKHFTKTNPAVDAEIKKLIDIEIAPTGANKTSSNRLPVVCCGPGNLALKMPTKADSEQTSDKNFVKNGNDGDLSTRWCSLGAGNGHSWQVELAKAKHVRSLRIHWEKDDAVYRYKVSASKDGENWNVIVDQSKNAIKGRVTPHSVDAPDTKYLKVTFVNSTPSYWASLWEFEAYESPELPPLPLVAVTTKATNARIADVTAPPGFDVTMFGSPPEVSYPVCIAAAATGELFVGVDPQGSLGKKPGQGKVLRCIDVDGDGRADQINEFAKMDHPRGLFFDNGSLWVLHPPLLSVFRDVDGDGIADEQEELITGITTNQLNIRGADHTTNGIRMGIDGWLYIAVGDFGFVNATGTDGRKLTKRGGGILRVRPDGTDMEVYNWGQRNILDVSIDPLMNIFTRDNTNDGGGWDIRLSHIYQSGDYGYPSLYLNFTEEGLPPLADYGGGSGCGSMFLHDLRWPQQYGNALYTCDWGRSEIYRHNLPSNGPTFDAHQEVFLKLPRPTDLDVDGSGRMYVASWKNGKFAYEGPDVGFVAQVVPTGFVPKPFPIMTEETDGELIKHLLAPSHVYQIHAQREIIRRGLTDQRCTDLLTAIKERDNPVHGRVAAIYTLKQLAGESCSKDLLVLMGDTGISVNVMRALTDRLGEMSRLKIGPFVEMLQHEDPRVQAQALISLGRIGDASAAEAILTLTNRSEQYARPELTPLYKQADPGRVLPHLAVQALVRCGSVEVCLKAIEGPYSDGALWALKYMHSTVAVNGLAKRLSEVRDADVRHKVITTLIRLYYREGEYKGDWWGTRPDRTGPYYDRQKWSGSDAISTVLKQFIPEIDAESRKLAGVEFARHKVKIEGLEVATTATAKPEPMAPIVIAEADSSNPDLIANLAADIVVYRASEFKGDVGRGAELFKKQNCVACHTTANGQVPKGPHLVDIGKRSKKVELLESVLKPSAKITQGFDTYLFQTVQGKVFSGFVTGESALAVQIRQTNGVPVTLEKKDIDERVKSQGSMMPVGLINNLTPEQLADLVVYLQSLK
jgi:putative membrane-bound dehydrogenase-like protein